MGRTRDWQELESDPDYSDGRGRRFVLRRPPDGRNGDAIAAVATRWMGSLSNRVAGQSATSETCWPPKKKDDRELSRLHHRVGTRTKYFWSPRSGKTRSNSIKGSPAKQSRRARENSRKTRNPRRNFVEDYTDVLTDKNKTHSMSGLRCRRRQLERKQNWICRHYLARRYTHKKTILRNHIVFICVVKSSET